MSQIKVNIKQQNIKYDINFTDNIFGYLEKNIKDFDKKKILYVVDSEVYKLHFNDEKCRDTLQCTSTIKNHHILILPHGEKNKNLKSVLKIIDELMEKNFTRKDLVVSIGGGVTGDITAFASSLFKRGINFIQVPTTLLSMFDSSVGGKTGVDFQGVKNGIGTFYSPKVVLVDQTFLKTLPQKELISGYFEGLKHALLLGETDYFDFKNEFDKIINKKFDKNTKEIILKNIGCKLNIVKSDPTETNGKRRVLNYGHTFGHALETVMNFKLPHGICVGLGIIFTNRLSYNLGYLKQEILEEVESFILSRLKKYSLPKLDFEQIYALMQNDKKNESNEINFILLKDFGEVFEKKCEKKDLEKVFIEFEKLFN
ncbi:MAG: 3-dehydroquinate synthase [Candidatus Gracilibacteria bacterium]|nr:3-dehydroquinate synthase [Candidatus Gracilibacteria bacterium]